MLICNALFDTPGILARSAAKADYVSIIMFSDYSPPQAHLRRRRFKLLYAVEPNTTSLMPKFFSTGGTGPEASTPAGETMEAFVSRLETHLNCQREEVNLYDLWASTHPHEDLAAAMSTIYQKLVYGHLAHTTVTNFIANYRAVWGPKAQPFIEATTRKRLEYGKNVTDFEIRTSERRLKDLKDWINSAVLPGPRSTRTTTIAATGTTAPITGGLADEKVGGEEEEEDIIPLLLYPQAWAQPAYRDEPSARDRLGPDGKPLLFWTGFSTYSLAYASGCPDIAVPLGEVPFTSRITGEDITGSTRLPVAISIMAPRGMDEALLGLLTELERAGVLKNVECGSRMFWE